ncbi:MAG: hypothetical protein FJ117_14470 [Deltaproteobacteria bacterium]|nr:hypothetical protein [Deltaproteobacteria bacterium]
MLLRKALCGILLSVAVFFMACAAKTPVHEKGITVAVWDLDDLTPSAIPRPPLGELLSMQIIETLQKKGDYVVVERERLILTLGELRLGTTSLVDEETRLKLGRLMGARRMIFGGYQIIGDQMRLDLRLLEVESGKVLKAVKKTASATDLPALLDTAKKAAEEL